ncbi:unnamed protein product [Rotaria sordida]|uniref:Uncharacterized protein n=1 Tax=Rotaria sordida TaxID=392033 RepID=A0A816DMJ7_9BILA|nr:unnamed protein product [Rotaria sordida]CAF1636109.1 unnamed protein product [Rotaria sordida]
MPYLKKFLFYYADDINDDFQITPCHKLINHFISPFWINKNWIIRIIIDNNKIIYLIRPESEFCYNFQDFKNHTSSSNYTHPGVRVHIKKSQHTPGNQIFINKINSLFSLMDITSLVINCHQMSANIFIKVLISLPHLDMIRIISSLEPELLMSHTMGYLISI